MLCKFLAHKLTPSSNQNNYIEVTGRHFYGTEYEIWADFGLVGNTEKTISGQKTILD